MFNISEGIKKMGSIFYNLLSNTYASASNNHIDYSGLQGCLFSSKKPLDDKWHSGYKSGNSEFMWESFDNKLYPGPIFKFVIENKLTSKSFSVAKEINILNTVLINHYGVLDVSRKSVEEEFNKYRASGFNFLEQREKLIENKNLHLSNTCDILAEQLVLNHGSCNIKNENIKASVKKLAISGYISRYSGEQGLSARLEDIIIKKEACIDEMQSMFGINHGLSSGNYDESESVTIVGVEAA